MRRWSAGVRMTGLREQPGSYNRFTVSVRTPSSAAHGTSRKHVMARMRGCQRRVTRSAADARFGDLTDPSLRDMVVTLLSASRWLFPADSAPQVKCAANRALKPSIDAID
jgi:hypothetical protein